MGLKRLWHKGNQRLVRGREVIEARVFLLK